MKLVRVNRRKVRLRVPITPPDHRLVYTKRRLPDDGTADRYARISYGLPVYSPIGAATKPFTATMIDPLPRFKTPVVARVVRTEGMGGLVHGQAISQPLFNPNEIPSGAVPA